MTLPTSRQITKEQHSMKQSYLIKQFDQPVSPIAFGTTKAGSAWDGAAADRLLNAWLDQGGNLVDTARVYTQGESERVLGDFFHRSGRRHEVVLLSKGGHPPSGAKHISRMSQQEMAYDLHTSLRTLQTDHIDIYFYHRDDVSRPVGELLECMESFRKAGKIRHYACSNWTTARMQEADAYAREHGLPGFIGNQALYNIGARHMLPPRDVTMLVADPAMLDYHRHSSNTLMPYSGVCNGFFHMLAAKGPQAVADSVYCTPGNLALARRMDELCRKYNASITQIMLGFFLVQDVPMIPLVTASTVEHLAEIAQTPDIAFDRADFAF